MSSPLIHSYAVYCYVYTIYVCTQCTYRYASMVTLSLGPRNNGSCNSTPSVLYRGNRNLCYHTATHSNIQVPQGLIVVAPGDLQSSPGSSDAPSQPSKWVYAIPHPVPARCIVLAIGQFSLFVDDRPPAVLSGAAEFLIPAEDVAGVFVSSCVVLNNSSLES